MEMKDELQLENVELHARSCSSRMEFVDEIKSRFSVDDVTDAPNMWHGSQTENLWCRFTVNSITFLAGPNTHENFGLIAKRNHGFLIGGLMDDLITVDVSVIGDRDARQIVERHRFTTRFSFEALDLAQKILNLNSH